MRDYGDLDLLVPPDEQRRARDLLEGRGYRLQQINHQVFQAVLNHPEKPAPVDLHTRVVSDFFPFDLPFDNLYERRTAVEVGGQSIQGLSTSDAILIQSIHGAKHHWFRLEWILAVACLMRDYGGLPGLLERADRLDCERMVLLAMVLSRRLFDASYQPRVEERLDEKSRSMRAVRAAAETVIDRMRVEDGTSRSAKRTHIMDFRFRSKLIPSVADKAKFWATALTKPRPKDRTVVPLPEPLSPLYRIIRPIRLLYEYRNTLLRQILS
jgi:hypothetical protein